MESTISFVEEDEVLRNLECNVANSGPNVDSDLALAKVLQQQENYFARLNNIPLPNLGEENVRPSDDPSNVAVPMDLDDADSTGEHDGLEHGEGWPSPLSPEGLQRLQSQQQRILLMYQDGAYNTEDEDDFDDDDIDPDSLSYEELLEVTGCVGTVTVGLNQDQIEMLPRVKYGDVQTVRDRGRECQETSQGVDNCVVCLEQYTDPDASLIQLPCRHIFHPECIAEWLKLKKVCPLCLVELESHEKKGASHSIVQGPHSFTGST